MKALQDRAAVKAAIEEARKVNNLDCASRHEFEAAWAEYITAKPAESA